MQQVCCVNHMCSLHLQISWWRVDVFDTYRFSVFTAFVSFILTYRLLALQQISCLCFAVLCRLLQSVLTCHDTCGLGAVCWWLSRQGLWEFNQSDDYRDARQRRPPTRQQRPRSDPSLWEDRCQLSEWVFTEAAVWFLFILQVFFYYCILILHRFSFSLWILINTLQNDNKPSWILKYLHKCKIQKVRWNWILQMVLETTMMQDKKQAGSETRVKIMWQTGSKNWNMTRKPTKDKHLTGRRAQREEPSAM